VNYKTLISLVLCVLLVAAVPAAAGTWSTQVVLSTNAYSGTVALDAAGNMVSVWYQSTLPNGTAVNEIWASTAAFGQPWSAPVNMSGPIGVSSGNPSVRSSTTGNATAIYTSPTLGGTFADHPAGGHWGTPGATNGVNQFYVGNDRGDQGLAWGTGGARATSSTVAAVQRPAGGGWTSATTIASAPHLSFDSAVVAPDGSMAVAWESFNSVCGSRTCKTSNWVLHVSTRAVGAQSWVDSGLLLGPDTAQHFGQLAADASGDLGVVAISGSNVVSLVRHGSAWSGSIVVAPLSSLQFYAGTRRDNRIFGSDSGRTCDGGRLGKRTTHQPGGGGWKSGYQHMGYADHDFRHRPVPELLRLHDEPNRHGNCVLEHSPSQRRRQHPLARCYPFGRGCALELACDCRHVL
jgi:hypothetical protein